MTDIRQARVTVAKALGYSSEFDGSPQAVSALAPEAREQLAIETVRFILARPEEFTANQVQTARILADKQNFGTLGDYAPNDLLDQASEFARAYGETAIETAGGVGRAAGNLASGAGINLGRVAAVVAVVAILYFGAPFVLPRLKAAFGKKPAA